MSLTWRFWHRYSPDPARLGLPSNTTSPSPPEGNGGRKNVEGGSEVPPGGFLDWEGERWTDDNGGEARAWESPQGDLHPAICWLRLSAPIWGLHRFSKVIPSKSPPSVPLPLFPPHPSLPHLFLSLLTSNKEVMSWREEFEEVRECYQHHYHSGFSLVQSTWFSNNIRGYWHILSQRIVVYILSKQNIVQPAEFWRTVWGIAFGVFVCCCLFWLLFVKPFTWMECLLRYSVAINYDGICNSLIIHCNI